MCKHCGSKEHETGEHHKKHAKHKALKKRSGEKEMAKVDAPGSKGMDIKR